MEPVSLMSRILRAAALAAVVAMLAGCGLRIGWTPPEDLAERWIANAPEVAQFFGPLESIAPAGEGVYAVRGLHRSGTVAFDFDAPGAAGKPVLVRIAPANPHIEWTIDRRYSRAQFRNAARGRA